MYHFTDVFRLPWIIASGELRIGKNKVGDLPDPDPLWATTDGRGDWSAAACRDHKRHNTILVRLSLDPEDFGPWRNVLGEFPQWTPAEMDRLAMLGKKLGGEPDKWFCRVTPLPFDRVKAIHLKKYNTGWLRHAHIETFKSDDGVGVTIIGEGAYVSKQFTQKSGAIGYETMIVPAADIRNLIQ